MQLTNSLIDSTGRYTRTAIALHWLLALLIPAQIGLGWYMLSVEKEPGSETLFALHISIGLTIALLLVLRVAWRAVHSPAVLPATLASWEARAARLSHLLLYVLMAASGAVQSQCNSLAAVGPQTRSVLTCVACT